MFCPAPGDPARYALDVEARALPVPAALRAQLGPDAMSRWGEIEVVAKLIGEPAHLVLRSTLRGEPAGLRTRHGITLQRADTPTHWRVIGRMLP